MVRTHAYISIYMYKMYWGPGLGFASRVLEPIRLDGLAEDSGVRRVKNQRSLFMAFCVI